MNKTICAVVAAVMAVVILLFFPLVLIGGLLTTMVAFLNPTAINKEQEDVHWQALQAVTARYNSENTIDVYLIKVIDLFHHDQITTDQGEIEDFIITYFLLELERKIEVTRTDENGDEYTETIIEIYYLYKSFYEIVSTVRAAPFLFGDGAISSIVNLSMSGLILGDGTSGGAVTPGGEGDGNMNGTLAGRYPAPVPNGRVTCGYGSRVNPVSGKTEFHPALDIQGEWHAAVGSLADGVVVTVNTDKSPYGNYIVIKHELPGETFYSKYAHLSKIDVSVGQSITQSQKIGVEGGQPGVDPNPGWSTGHHLHLEIWTDEGHVNPGNYIY